MVGNGGLNPPNQMMLISCASIRDIESSRSWDSSYSTIEYIGEIGIEDVLDTKLVGASSSCSINRQVLQLLEITMLFAPSRCCRSSRNSFLDEHVAAKKSEFPHYPSYCIFKD